MHKTDVILLGGGIAGLVLSLLLQRRKIDHVVIDRIQKQKSMALAETLPPSAMPLLERLDLLDLFDEVAIKRTYGYHAMVGGRLQSQDFFQSNPFKYGLKIDKQALEEELAESAGQSIIACKQVNQIVSTDDGVQVSINQDGADKTFAGNVLVDATGRKRAGLEALGVPIINHGKQLAFSCHLPIYKHSDLLYDVVTETFPKGWGIVSALNKQEQVMTLYTDLSDGHSKDFGDYANWAELLQETIYLKHYLSQETSPQVVGQIANTSVPERFAHQNWLAIGDAAMAFDPLSSHGITNAIYTANRAANCLADASRDLDAYDVDLSDIFEGYLAAKEGLQFSH